MWPLVDSDRRLNVVDREQQLSVLHHDLIDLNVLSALNDDAYVPLDFPITHAFQTNDVDVVQNLIKNKKWCYLTYN